MQWLLGQILHNRSAWRPCSGIKQDMISPDATIYSTKVTIGKAIMNLKKKNLKKRLIVACNNYTKHLPFKQEACWFANAKENSSTLNTPIWWPPKIS